MEPCHERCADEDAAAMDNPWNEVTEDTQRSEQSKLAKGTLSYSKDCLDHSDDATQHTRPA
jgi:hypothetical protein